MNIHNPETKDAWTALGTGCARAAKRIIRDISEATQIIRPQFFFDGEGIDKVVIFI